MFSIQNVKAQKVYSPPDNSDVLVVNFDIYNDEEEDEKKQVAGQKSLSFPLGTTPEELEEELRKFIQIFNSDFVKKQESAKREKDQEQADKTIEAVEGLAISAETENNKEEAENE